ncbi:hypothetical protein [Pseudovibrio sp. SPO723]|uniref:hypothetical protein n=1 Tax=Nesiotobacter zosterae TaxID=392721 RepID=UPI0029C123F1|nr:hypothetical protein [Pseudovibrio sp. SPO723]MDX5592562.1 hypothetical protein [Pseudovibrio sp. SPO723]
MTISKIEIEQAQKSVDWKAVAEARMREIDVLREQVKLLENGGSGRDEVVGDIDWGRSIGFAEGGVVKGIVTMPEFGCDRRR